MSSSTYYTAVGAQDIYIKYYMLPTKSLSHLSWEYLYIFIFSSKLFHITYSSTIRSSETLVSESSNINFSAQRSSSYNYLIIDYQKNENFTGIW